MPACVPPSAQIDPWWLEQHRELHDIGVWLRTKTFAELDAQDMQQLKRRGFSDAQLARLLGAGRGRGAAPLLAIYALCRAQGACCLRV